MRQPAPGTMTREQASDFIRARAALYVRDGYEPEVAVSKASSELRRIRAADLVETMAAIKRNLGF